jgi:hypothetical protein
MSTISTALHNFEEPTKEHLSNLHILLSITQRCRGQEVGAKCRQDGDQCGAEFWSSGSRGFVSESSIHEQQVWQLTGLCSFVDQGGETAYHPTLSRIFFLGPEIRPIYYPLVNNKESGEIERAGGHLRPQPLDVAWHENRVSSFVYAHYSMFLTPTRLFSLPRYGPLLTSFVRYSETLKVELQRGQMKRAKGFVKTCYSEALISSTSTVAENEREEKEDAAPRESTYHRGVPPACASSLLFCK